MASKQIKLGISKSAGGSSGQPSKMQSLLATADTQILTLEALQETFKAQVSALEGKITSVFEEKIKDVSEEMAEIKEIIQTQNKEIREDIVLALQGLAGHVESLEERVEEINQFDVNLENKVGEVQIKMEKTDAEVTMIQYRAMEFALRVRPERK